jgi:hypothetical protein
LEPSFAEITATHAGDPAAFVDAVLAIDSIFGDLSGDEVLRDAVLRGYRRVLSGTATDG